MVVGRRFHLARWLRALLSTAVVAMGLTSAAIVAPSAVLASGTLSCLAKTYAWYISLGYYFARSKDGWVISDDPGGKAVIGTLSLSVSGASFDAFESSLKASPSYTATYHGTLAGDCSMGPINPPGTGLPTTTPLAAPSRQRRSTCRRPPPYPGPSAPSTERRWRVW